MVQLAGPPPVRGWAGYSVEPLVRLGFGTVPDQVPNLLAPEINYSISLNVVSLICFLHTLWLDIGHLNLQL